MNLEKLFNPASIAIVGASEEEGKVGNVMAKNILTLGYQGKIFLVNPKHETLFNQKCYKNLTEIEEAVDLAVISIPAKFVADEIRNNAEKIKNYVIISAGFSEMSEEGKAREEEIKKIADEKELNILGPNCLGFMAPGIKLNATFAGGMAAIGNIALVSQSGALAVGMLDIAEKEKFGFSYVVSVGNKMDIDESELLDYLRDDEKTKVIGMYLEGIKNGTKFMESVSKVSKIKPVVLIKAGKTEKSQKAISSHTGALAGSDEIITAVCEKTGVIRAENLEEFFNLLNLISLTNPPANDQVVVITNAGGPGVLTTDAFKDKNIKLIDISDKDKEKMKKILPEESALGNPIDVLGDAHEDRYKKVLAILSKNENIGSYISVLTPQDQTPVAKIATKIIQFSAKGGSASGGKNKTKASVVTVFIGAKRVEKAIRKLKENGIANFNFPDAAVNALDKYYLWSKQKEKAEVADENIDETRKVKILSIIGKAKSENRGALYFSEAREVMKMYGINTVSCVDIFPGNAENGGSTSIREVEPPALSFPVALKVDSDKVLHKTDKQGLVLDIKNEEELKSATGKMQADFPGARLIVQPMLPRKTELILGIKKDPMFGPVIVYGLGGIYTEVLKMVNFLILPLTPDEIENSLAKSKISFLFRETRGQSPYNIKELAGILHGLGRLAREIDEIREFDINPLLIYNDGMGAMVVDVKIII